MEVTCRLVEVVDEVRTDFLLPNWMCEQGEGGSMFDLRAVETSPCQLGQLGALAPRQDTQRSSGHLSGELWKEGETWGCHKTASTLHCGHNSPPKIQKSRNSAWTRLRVAAGSKPFQHPALWPG